jgi:GT2 family glycosyltransferase
VAPPTGLAAPAAVRRIDVDAPVADLDLGTARAGGAYRGLGALVERGGRPIGFITLPAAAGRVTAGALERALAPLRDAPPHPTGDGAADAPRPAGTVAVTTCDNPGPLLRCLESILAGLAPGDGVIVVENRPSGSRVPAALRDRFGDDPRIAYVEEGRPGLGRARNAGLDACTTEFIAFTDDDVVADARWSRSLFGALAREPRAAVVTGLIVPLSLETPSQVTLEEFAGFSKGFARRRFRLSEPPEDDPLFPYAAGLFGSGANIAARTRLLREMGGFDPSLGTGTPAWGGEDLELFTRTVLSGHDLVYEPAGMVWHEHPDTLRRLRRQAYGYGAGLGAALAKQVLVGPARAGLVRRIPGGVRHLFASDSRKNERKGAGYPRSLTVLELAGILAGPVGYVRSRIATRRMGG